MKPSDRVTLPMGAVLELGEEVRINRRRTRAVMQGELDGAPVYVKVYRGLSGRWKGRRTASKAQELRRRVTEVTPDLLYAGRAVGVGWVLIYEALLDAETLDWLKHPAANDSADATLQDLTGLMARLHRNGVWQRDTNLTNFVVAEGRFFLLDEDDLRFTEGGLKPDASMANLASLLARVPWLDEAQLVSLLSEYAASRDWSRPDGQQVQQFLAYVETEHAARQKKRAKQERNEDARE